MRTRLRYFILRIRSQDKNNAPHSINLIFFITIDLVTCEGLEFIV